MAFYLNKSTKVKLLTLGKLTAETTAKPSKGFLFSVNLDSSIACLLRTIGKNIVSFAPLDENVLRLNKQYRRY